MFNAVFAVGKKSILLISTNLNSGSLCSSRRRRGIARLELKFLFYFIWQNVLWCHINVLFGVSRDEHEFQLTRERHLCALKWHMAIANETYRDADRPQRNITNAKTSKTIIIASIHTLYKAERFQCSKRKKAGNCRFSFHHIRQHGAFCLALLQWMAI